MVIPVGHRLLDSQEITNVTKSFPSSSTVFVSLNNGETIRVSCNSTAESNELMQTIANAMNGVAAQKGIAIRPEISRESCDSYEIDREMERLLSARNEIDAEIKALAKRREFLSNHPGLELGGAISSLICSIFDTCSDSKKRR